MDRAQVNQIFENVLNQQTNEDPFVKQKIIAKELYLTVFEILKDERGVHIESAIAILGALAGHAVCQEVKAQIAAGQQPHLVRLTGKDGRNYWLGDGRNHFIFYDQYSLVNLLLGQMQSMGWTKYPDAQAMVGDHVAKMGGPEFGQPDIPDKHRPIDLPINLVKHLWPKLSEIFGRYGNNGARSTMICGLALQELIKEGQSVISADLAVTIALQYALPVSMVDPDSPDFHL